MKPFRVSMAPDQLWQSINPWRFYNQGAQFGMVNIALGNTPRPDIERKLLEEVGTYGRQLGRIGDAVEVLMRRVDPEQLTGEERDAFAILAGQLAEIRKIKARERASDEVG